MTLEIPESHQWLLEEPVVANLGTIMPDGRPQVNPVWVDHDDTHLRLNSAKGRQKDRNLREREYATVLLVDPDNPYFYVEIRGRVAEVIEGGEAEPHIDTLAKKYLGKDEYPWRQPGSVRMMYKIEPERIVTYGE